MLWAGFALLTAVTAGLLLYPLWNPSRRQRRAAYDIEVYKAQLREVDAEAARGGLAADDAVAARLEIERRLLRVDNGPEAEFQSGDGLKTDGSLMNFETGARRLLIPLIIAGVLFGAFLMYGRLGSPRMPDMPLEGRELTAEEITPENVVSELTVLADKLAARMKSDPNDGDGWRLLGRTNQELGRYAAAAAAYARAAEVFPDEADLQAYEGENLVFQAEGTVTPRALRAFKAALRLDPEIPAARYYVGLAYFQAGELQQAYDRWLELGQTSAPEAPWLADLQQDIDRAASAIGITAARITPDTGIGGPKAADMAAAQALSEQERATMVRGMVDRLAERLKGTPNDADGWMRLGKARSVLGEFTAAAEAYGKAASLRPEDIEIQLSSGHASLKTVPKGTPVPEQVLEAFRRVHALDPKNFDGLWFTGLGHLQSGRKDDARRLWERARDGLPGEDPRRRLVIRQLKNLTGR